MLRCYSVIQFHSLYTLLSWGRVLYTEEEGVDRKEEWLLNKHILGGSSWHWEPSIQTHITTLRVVRTLPHICGYQEWVEDRASTRGGWLAWHLVSWWIALGCQLMSLKLHWQSMSGGNQNMVLGWPPELSGCRNWKQPPSFCAWQIPELLLAQWLMWSWWKCAKAGTISTGREEDLEIGNLWVVQRYRSSSVLFWIDAEGWRNLELLAFWLRQWGLGKA